MAIAGALERSSEPAHILVGAILEGCINETISAVHARQAAHNVARGAHDPALAAAMGVVADDEQRHAELSWSFVRWLLSVRPELRLIAAATFDSYQLPPAPVTAEEDLSRFGLLSRADEHAIASEILARVVRPCADALLQRASADSVPEC